MTRIIALLAVGLCLVGCQRDFSDPILRQQLTAMVTGLNEYGPALNAQKDLDALLLVNSSKLSKSQKLKLTTARDTLSRAIEVCDAYYAGKIPVERYGEFKSGLEEARKLIAETAGTF